MIASLAEGLACIEALRALRMLLQAVSDQSCKICRRTNRSLPPALAAGTLPGSKKDPPTNSALGSSCA